MAPAPTIPLAFGFLGLSTLFIISGLKGNTVADVFQGKATGNTLTPDAGLKPLNSAIADELNLNGITGGADSGVAGLTPPTIPGTGPSGAVIFDGHPVAGWIVPQLQCARKHGWGGSVTSGVRTNAEQRQACINVCGNPNGCPGRCARPGTSNHRGTRWPLGAVDVTDPDGLERALKSCPSARGIRRGLIEDRVHFSWSGN